MNTNVLNKGTIVNRYLYALLLVTLMLYPYVFLLNMVRPAQLLGVNLYVLLATCAIGTVFFGCIGPIVRRHGMYLLPIVLLPLLCLIALRMLAYDESFKHIVIHKAPLLFVVLWGVASSSLHNESRRMTVRRIIIITCVIQAIFGIVHFYFFPYIQTYGVGEDPDETYLIHDEEGYEMGALRESGILMNPTVYANVVVLGVFALAQQRRDKGTFPAFLEYAFLIILFWGVILSRSRYPSAVAVVLLGLYVLKRLTAKTMVLAVMLAVISFGVLLPQLANVMLRFREEGGTLRSMKNEVGMSIVSHDAKSMVFGASDRKVKEARTIEGVVFSDNSFLTLMLTYGIPFCMVWVMVVYLLYRQTVPFGDNVLILLYYLGILWFTNGILWDIWVLYFLCTLYSIQPQELACRSKAFMFLPDRVPELSCQH